MALDVKIGGAEVILQNSPPPRTLLTGWMPVLGNLWPPVAFLCHEQLFLGIPCEPQQCGV